MNGFSLTLFCIFILLLILCPITVIEISIEKDLLSVLRIPLSNLMLFICLSGYTCALQKDILYQGRMFVSDHWICFHSKVFGKDTKVP